MKRRGFSLIEVIVYCMLVMLVLTAVYAVYFMGARTFNYTSESFQLGADIQAAVVWLRNDLKMSDLGSIVAYPNLAHPDEPPGVSLESPQSYVEPTHLLLNEAGGPKFDKFVFYTLVPDAAMKNAGVLVRWEQQLKSSDPKYSVPHMSDVLPSSRLDHAHERVVLRNVALPHVVVAGGGIGDLGPHGGFEVSYLQKPTDSAATDYVEVEDNPTQFTDLQKPGLSKLSTPYVQVRLKMLTYTQQTGKEDFFPLRLRITPRN
jgi:hypothetical protein